MIVTNQCRYVNGKMVWDRPPTEAEKAADAARFAEMCATRTAAPMLGSEKAFLADVGFRDHGLGDHPLWQQEMIIRQAKRAGIAVDGKRYFGGLADGRGVADPGAWCATQQDYIDEAKKKDLIVHSGCGVGGVNYDNGYRPPKPTPVDLAPDIVDRLAKQYVAKDPDLAQKPVQEIKEMVVENHGRKRANRKKTWVAEKDFKDIDA